MSNDARAQLEEMAGTVESGRLIRTNLPTGDAPRHGAQAGQTIGSVRELLEHIHRELDHLRPALGLTGESAFEETIRLRAETQRLQTEVVRLSTEVNQLREAHSHSQQLRAEAERKVADLNESLKDAEEARKSFQFACERAESKAEALEDQVSDARNKLKALAEERAKWENEATRFADLIAGLGDFLMQRFPDEFAGSNSPERAVDTAVRLMSEMTGLMKPRPLFEPAVDQIQRELGKATEAHSGIKSPHEGIAVILEEYLELQEEVFKKKPDPLKMLKEATQLGAMAARFIRDLGLVERVEAEMGEFFLTGEELRRAQNPMEESG